MLVILNDTRFFEVPQEVAKRLGYTEELLDVEVPLKWLKYPKGLLLKLIKKLSQDNFKNNKNNNKE